MNPLLGDMRIPMLKTKAKTQAFLHSKYTGDLTPDHHLVNNGRAKHKGEICG